MKALVGLQHHVRGFLDLDVVEIGQVREWISITRETIRRSGGWTWPDGDFIPAHEIIPAYFRPKLSPALAQICGEA